MVFLSKKSLEIKKIVITKYRIWFFVDAYFPQKHFQLPIFAVGDIAIAVIGAGSLGPKPGLGIQLYGDLPAAGI